MNSNASTHSKTPPSEEKSIGRKIVQFAFGPGAFFTVLFAFILGHMVLGYWHIGQMIVKPHYQYVLLLPIAVWLLSMRTNEADVLKISAQPGRPIIVLASASGILLLIVAATYIWSPWMAGVSAVLSTLLVLYWYGGNRLVKTWLPAWILCWTAIPLPFQLDERLTVGMKSFSTQWSSRFLDEFGILHLSYSNVIELPDKQLFVADACSGIHSLFVLIAAGLFIALWNHRTLLHTVSLLVLSFGLAIVENISRLTIVAFSWTRGLDVTSGRPHEFLGFLLFAVTILLLISADQFLKAILPGKQFYPEFSALFQRIFLRRMSRKKKTVRKSEGEASLRKTPWPGMLVICWAFPVLGAVQVARIPSDAPNIGRILAADLELERLAQEILPKEISGYQLKQHDFIKRVEGDPLGRNSELWEYQKGNLTFRISRDWPYNEVHDLCLCYFNTGWKITSPRTVQGMGSDTPYVEATMARPLYGSSYLLFSQCNEKGRFSYGRKSSEQIGRPRSEDERSLIIDKFKSVFGTGKSKGLKPTQGPFFQVHLIARSPQEPTDEQKEELKEIYNQLRNLIVSATLNVNKTNSDEVETNNDTKPAKE